MDADASEECRQQAADHGGRGACVRVENGFAQNPIARRRVDDAFQELDKNSDGVLSSDEVPAELHTDRQRYDTNQDGVIDLDEFRTAAKNLHIFGGKAERNGKTQKHGAGGIRRGLVARIRQRNCRRNESDCLSCR